MRSGILTADIHIAASHVRLSGKYYLSELTLRIIERRKTQLKMFVQLLFALLGALLYFLYSRGKRADEMMREVKLLPGTLPLIGYGIRGISLAYGGKNAIREEFLRVLQLKEDHRSSFIGLQGFIAVEVDTIKAIYNSPHAISKSFQYKFLPFMNDGIACAQSEEKWKPLRKTVMTFFNPKYSEEVISIINDRTKTFIEILKETEGTTIHVEEYLLRNTWDIVSKIFFGVDENQQVERGSILPNFIGPYFEDLLHTRSIFFWFNPDFVFKRTSFYKNYIKLATKHFDHTKELMRRSIESYEAKEASAPQVSSSRKPYSLLYKEQLETHNNEKATLPKIANGTNDILIAGSETVTVQVSTLLYFLAVYPEYQEKVYEEVMELYGGGDWSKQQLSRMVYLDMALQEALRLSSAIITGRVATGDIDIGKCTIPEGTIIIFFPRNNQVSETYIKDPMRFNPDNFLPERVRERPKDVFLPYTAGPRVCPGQAMGSYMAKCIVAETVRHFHISTNLDPKDVQYVFRFLTEFSGGYPVTLTRRKEACFSEPCLP